VDGHKIRFSLGAWFSYDEQKDFQESLFFSLGRTGRKAILCRGKLSARRRRRENTSLGPLRLVVLKYTVYDNASIAKIEMEKN